MVDGGGSRIATFATVIRSRKRNHRCPMLLLTILSAIATSGEWSNRADLPGNPRLVDLDRAKADRRFLGRSKVEIETALGATGRQVLAPTADGGWIEWDAGSPDKAQTWVYSLHRMEARNRPRVESRRENRRLLLNFDEAAKVASVGWACDTTAWRAKGRLGD
jgi:hypothetical protein